MLLTLLASFVFGQAPPQAFNYSSVIRDDNKQAIPNTLVSIRLNINKSSPFGTSVYSEIHTLKTNKFGVVNLQVGNGVSKVGVFADIDWGEATYYLQTELDDEGGTDFEMMGSSQFLSVPYALYSGASENDLNDNDTSRTNEIQVLSVSNDTIFLTNGGFAVLPAAYSGTNTDSQTLSYHNDTISISNGNSIAVPGLGGASTLGKKIGYNNVATGSVASGWRVVPHLTSSDTLQLNINVNGPHETFIVHAGFFLTNLGSTGGASKSAIWVYNSYGSKVRSQTISNETHSNGQMLAGCAGSMILADLPPGQYTVRVMHELTSNSSPGNLYFEGQRHLLVRRF